MTAKAAKLLAEDPPPQDSPFAALPLVLHSRIAAFLPTAPREGLADEPGAVRGESHSVVNKSGES